MKVACQHCSKEFVTYPAWIRKGAGKTCSYECMGLLKRGYPSYSRTAEHRAKMSAAHKALDQTRNRKRFIKINAEKKGRTIEELYPDKAVELRKLGKQLVGENNPNWKGGKHRNKYPWIFFKLRPAVIARDGSVCMNCGMTNQEHQDKYSNRGLTVHHIDYNKENNSLKNLITLCIWCNCKANGKREEWQTHYVALLG